MTDKEVLLLRRKLDLLLRTGKLLMESAADTNRIERNMKRVAAFMGIPEEKLHIDIRWTMIMVNVSDERNSFSKFQKCEKHGINMTTISQVSKLSWRAIEQDYSLDKYEEELEKIVRQPRNYTPYIVAIGAGFACGGFCKLFGGDWIAFLLTSICTFIGFRVRTRCVEAGLNAYMGIALAAFICTCLAYASSFLGISGTPYLPLLACALFIVPGVPLINFVDDMIDNHLLVGITRAANTVMMVAAMTFGIAGCANVYPKTLCAIYTNFIKGDLEAAQQAQDAIASFRSVFRYGNPNTIIKKAVSLDYPVGDCRRPFNYISDEGMQALKTVMQENRDRGLF